MNEQKMGVFIKRLRTEKNYTQKELAAQLNITDKAISKWERGLSCPDISFILPLSKILECSTSELLNGEKADEPLSENIESTINEALIYSDRNTQNKLERIKSVMLVSLSAIFALAIVICFICDFCITGKLSWSLLVLVSVLFAWMILIPLLYSKKKSIRKTLLIISLGIIPYLLLLGNILSEPLIYTLGTVIAIISIIGLWCAYFVICKLHHRKYCASGVVFLIIIPMTWGINHAISYFIQGGTADPVNDFVNIGFCIILAAICFGIDYASRHKKRG